MKNKLIFFIFFSLIFSQIEKDINQKNLFIIDSLKTIISNLESKKSNNLKVNKVTFRSKEELKFQRGKDVLLLEYELNIPKNSIITTIDVVFSGIAQRFNLLLESDKLGIKTLSTTIKRLDNPKNKDGSSKQTLYYKSTPWLDIDDPYSGYIFDASSTYKQLTFGLHTPPITILDNQTLIKLTANEHKEPEIKISDVTITVYYSDINLLGVNEHDISKHKDIQTSTFKGIDRSMYIFDETLDHFNNNYIHVINSNHCPNGLMYSGGHCYARRDYDLAMQIYKLIPTLIPGSPDDPNFRYYYIGKNTDCPYGAID